MEGVQPQQIFSILKKEFLQSQEYRQLIEPIIIQKGKEGDFNAVELLNRLSYTIVDQQRDVRSFIIPIWTTMMQMNLNPEFFRKSPLAKDFVQTILKAYGHKQ